MGQNNRTRVVLHKVPKTRNFTQLENAALRDMTLSFRATGLLAYLMSLPDGAPIDSTTLTQRKQEGRDAIRTAYRELESAGYVRREKVQGTDGLWSTVTYVSEQPGPGNPASVDQSSVSQALSLSESKTNDQEEDRFGCGCGSAFPTIGAYQDHLEVCDTG